MMFDQRRRLADDAARAPPLISPRPVHETAVTRMTSAIGGDRMRRDVDAEDRAADDEARTRTTSDAVDDHRQRAADEERDPPRRA